MNTYGPGPDDRYYVITDLKEENYQWDNLHRLCIFSFYDYAVQYFFTLPGRDFTICEKKWGEITDEFANYHLFAVVDHEGVGVQGVYETYPITP